MKFRAPWRFAAALAVLALAGVARAEVKDPAELLPAQTLACLEVRQPERLAREVSGLLKGSDLDDMPSVMARFREKMGDNMPFFFFNEGALLSIFFSPEMINECGRIQGGIVGVTSVGKDGPEIVGVVLAGDSNFPTYYLRMMLTIGFNTRSVGEVEGVRVYGQRWQHYEPAVAGAPPVPPKWEDSGPYMALLPSTIVLGSTPDSVKDVIRRFKGKSSEPSLASVAAYKDAAKQRDKPGLFAYTDIAALAQQMDAAGKNLGSYERQWRLLKAAVNPKAVHGATASLTLQNGVVELKARVDLDPKQVSPLVDFLTAKAAPSDALYFTPRDGMLTLGLNLNDGEKRWGKLMDLIDSLNKPEPGEADRPAPSAVLRDAEDRVKLHIAKDVLGRVTSAAVVVEPMAATSPNGRPVPLLVLQASDADAAKYLEEQAFPRLLGLTSLLRGQPGEAPVPIRQDVGGRSLSVMTAVGIGDLLSAKNIYVGREGAVVVIGSDDKQVAAALNAGAKKEGLLGEEKTAAAVKDLDEPLAVAVFSLSKGLVELFKAAEQPNSVITLGPGRPLPPPPPLPGVPEKPPESAKMTKRAEKTIADAAKVVEPLPPTVFSLSHKADALTLEMRQSGLKSVSTKMIDLWIEAGLERMVEQQNPQRP